MTQRPNGRGALPAKDVVNLSDLLLVMQLVIQPKTMIPAATSNGRYRCCAPISAPDLLLTTPTDQE